MTIERNYFRVIYQHFEEGLYAKTLSMEQAIQLANLIMAHVPKMLRQPVTLNQEPKALPEPSKVFEGDYL